MKTDFPTLIKSMRLVLKPEFDRLDALKDEEHDQMLAFIESKSLQMIQDNGYTEEEFYTIYAQYYMDFSSNNPDEWIIKLDPNNAQVIVK